MSHSLKSLISYDADSDDDDAAGGLDEAPTSHPGSSTSTPAKTRRVLVRKKPKPIPLVAYAHEEDEDQEKEDSASGDESLEPMSPSPLDDSEKSTDPHPSSSSSTRARPRVELPATPNAKCSHALQQKIASLLKKKRDHALCLNDNIQNRKDFRNPSIHEKLIDYLGIDELGSDYSEATFSWSDWGSDCYYDKLAKSQKDQYERKEKEKTKRTQIEFASSGGVAAAKRSAAAAMESAKKRKSKWDVEEGKKVAGVGPDALVASKVAAMNIGLVHQPLANKKH